jgi:hypothetical protein
MCNVVPLRGRFGLNSFCQFNRLSVFLSVRLPTNLQFWAMIDGHPSTGKNDRESGVNAGGPVHGAAA